MVGWQDMVGQTPELHARLLALHLDVEDCEEAEYHAFLQDVIRPVEEALAALRVAMADERCAEWGVANRGTLMSAAEALKASQPSECLALYRRRFLEALELYLRASGAWTRADQTQGADCAGRARLVWDEAEDLIQGLI